MMVLHHFGTASVSRPSPRHSRRLPTERRAPALRYFVREFPDRRSRFFLTIRKENVAYSSAINLVDSQRFCQPQ